jgi:hypothetical protein
MGTDRSSENGGQCTDAVILLQMACAQCVRGYVQLRLVRNILFLAVQGGAAWYYHNDVPGP